MKDIRHDNIYEHLVDRIVNDFDPLLYPLKLAQRMENLF